MLEWTFLDTWIVIVGMLGAMSCALLGNYLVLRRMSMMGDAISHAVLPGLAIAFLISGSRESLPMLIGAILIGVLTTLFIQGIDRLSGLDRGASMGVVFTTLFALGLILIRQAADQFRLPLFDSQPLLEEHHFLADGLQRIIVLGNHDQCRCFL